MALRTKAPAFLRKADDEKAFERLYERHVRDVYRYAVAMLGATPDAEDVTQTTFLNAYRAFKGGTRPGKPRSWLIAIAHNVCRQRFRQAQRRPHEVAFDERVGEGTVDEINAPTAEDLRRALSQLPPNQRAAIVMRELEGCTYTEIADVLDISVSALETLLFRARRALREQLEEQLTCREAAFAISRQLDSRLSLAGRRSLRAHLRACAECNSLAQSQRAQRRGLKALVLVPLPATLSHWMHGQSAAAATGAGLGAGGASSVVFGGVAAKVAAVVVAGVVVGGGTYEGVKRVEHPAARTVQPPAARVEFASATVPRVSASNSSESRFETPKRAAWTTPALVNASPRANAHAQGVAHKASPPQQNSQVVPPGETARAIAHTPVALRSSPPGLAVKALRSAAPASANSHSQPGSKQNAHSAQGATPSHPVHPVHPEHPSQSQSPSQSAESPSQSAQSQSQSAQSQSNGQGNSNGTPPEHPGRKSTP